MTPANDDGMSEWYEEAASLSSMTPQFDMAYQRAANRPDNPTVREAIMAHSSWLALDTDGYVDVYEWIYELRYVALPGTEPIIAFQPKRRMVGGIAIPL